MINKPTRGFSAPRRYFQGPKEIENIYSYTSIFGKKVFMLIDVVFFEQLTNKYKAIYEEQGGILVTELFKGQITDKEVVRISDKAAKCKPDVLVGIGGGKTLDAIKAVADNLKIPVITVPTSAATNAPGSSLSVIYNEDGTYNYDRYYNKNPDIVLVDSEIIAKAPIRYLIAGIGDALSAYFEARANSLADNANYINLRNGGGYRRTRTAMTMAGLCYDILLKDSLKAKLDAEAGVCSEALENIIEAIILISAVVFENTGCAGAHALNFAIAVVPGGTKPLHGEKVAFGVIVQLVAEGSPMSEISEVIEFCMSLGLPITLEDMGVESTNENIEAIAKASMGFLWDSEPFKVTWELVFNAIKSANALGHYFKDKNKMK